MKWHEKKNFHNLLKKLNTPLNCPGMKWKLNKDHNNGDGDFDEEIIPLLIQLNTDSWHTVASCAGHTLRDIETHHKGYLINTPYRIVVFIHASIKSIERFRDMVEEMKSATSGHFTCTIGSNKEDYGNHTEEGFLPFEIEVHCHTKRKRDKDLLELVKVAKAHNIA